VTVLRNIEQKIEGLFEGLFGRAFRTHVQPVELARKLAKEMDDHRVVSVSRVYVPNEYTVYLAPDTIGAGIGTVLYEALFVVLADEDVHRACAGITMPNDASVRLHEKFGFRRVGVFTEQGRKFGRYWDVAWYERKMP
jgi:RimJ/RimL family protein N-acetyltransferase